MSFEPVRTGDEVRVTGGKHAGKFGRVQRTWRENARIRVHNEHVGDGPKVILVAHKWVEAPSAIDQLARLGRKTRQLIAVA